MQPPDNQGFDTSHSRIFRDIALIAAAVILVVYGGYWVLSSMTGWALSMVPESVDTFIGEHASTMNLAGSETCDDPAMAEFVNKLTEPLLEQVADEPYEFSFVVVENEEPNAFALPGGFVTIHSGLITSAASGEEVAGVLAHEIAHVTERHGLKRILRQAGISIAIGLVFGSTEVAVLADYASELGGLAYDRDQERDADEHGRTWLRDARIDPRGMATFFERLKEESGGSFPEFLSTHPDLDERVQAALDAGGIAGEALKLPAPAGLRCKVPKAETPEPAQEATEDKQ
jgi:predicted Zn-dependent protease